MGKKATLLNSRAQMKTCRYDDDDDDDDDEVDLPGLEFLEGRPNNDTLADNAVPTDLHAGQVSAHYALGQYDRL